MPTITIDGTEHTVELEAITFDDGQRVLTSEEIEAQYVPRTMIEGDEAQYVHRQSMERRYKNYVNKAKAVDDEDLVAQILAKHGEAVKAEGLEAAKEQWSLVEVTPREQRIRELEEDLGTFRGQVVGSAIEAAARAVWKPEFATAPEGRRSWAQVNFSDEFAYDAEFGYVVAVNAKREPVPSGSPTARRPFMSVDERFRQLAAQDAYKPFALPPERITTPDGAAPGETTKPTEPPKKRRSEMTTKEKSEYVDAHGKVAFSKLPL